MAQFILLMFLLLLRTGWPEPGAVMVQTEGRSGLLVSAGSVTSPYRIMTVFVLPGDTVRISVAHDDTVHLSIDRGALITGEPNAWRWVAPSGQGLVAGSITTRTGQALVTLNLFLMVPYGHMEGEYLNGYRIGTYPKKPLRQLAIYNKPRGFVEVTPENQEVLLSPHFRLKQFLCKQEGGYPKYVIIREKLLLKLELVLEQANERGYRAQTFNILSGYRTPYYNKAIGNVQYSRHIYGGAADIFIDEEPPFDMMDDLNGDGLLDYRDADVLKEMIEEMFGRTWYEPFIGGLGRYGRTDAHGPFIHMDVRGFRARW